MKNPVVLSMLGTMLEVYDFLIYSMLASFLTKVFFFHSDSYLSYLETFIVFSAGYLSRPLGGMIIGSFGDRFGRKNTLAFSLQLMAVCTFLIAFLPSYHTAGIISPILLMIIRILQGIAHGAELPGALVYVIETSKEKKRNFHSSFVFFGGGIGGCLSTLVIYILTRYFTDTQIIAFAWRIPFVIGGSLSIIAIYFRLKASESLLFSNLKIKEKKPLSYLIKNNASKLMLGIGITIFPVLLIILGHYLPAYLKEFTNYSSQEIYFSMLCGTIVFTGMIPLIGYLISFISSYVVLLVVTISILLLSSFFLVTMEVDSVLQFVVFYKLLSAIFIACYPCMVVSLFPTNIRYTGTALSYNIAFTIAAVLLFITTSLTRKFHVLTWTPALVVIAAIFNLIILTLYNKKKKINYLKHS